MQPTFHLSTARGARQRPGRSPKLINCGKFGRLSIPQIAVVAGVTDPAIRQRIRRGWNGEQLCEPIGERPNAKRGEIRVPTMLTAVQLARQFRDRVPTVQEIRKAKPMSREAAVRWRQAIRTAFEADSPQEASDA